MIRRILGGVSPAPRRILGVAVTRMADGFCFAGLDVETGQWVRPTRPKVRTDYDRALLAHDFGASRPHEFALAVSEWAGLRPAPTPPHVEDWLLQPSPPARIVSRPPPDELARLLAAATEESLAPVDPGRQRSLALVCPEALKMEFGIKQDKYQVSLVMKLNDRWYGYWKSQCVMVRAWGRRLLREREVESCGVTHRDLSRMGHRSVRVAIGLSRPYVANGREDCWPMVIAVIADPPLAAEVDYHDL